jgi:hypothetical protein
MITGEITGEMISFVSPLLSSAFSNVASGLPSIEPSSSTLETLTQAGALSLTLLMAVIGGRGSGGGPYRSDGRPDPAAGLKGKILSRHADGRGRQIRLSEDQPVGDDPFSKGSVLLFSDEGFLAEVVLPRKWRVRGYLCSPKGSLAVEKNREGTPQFRETSVQFHKNGRLKAIGLAEDSIIDLITDRLSLKSGATVYFDEAGRVRRLFLPSRQEVLGLQLAAQTGVGFYENGRISCVDFINPQKEIKGLPGFMGSRIDFHENGKVQSGQLNSDQRIQGLKLPGEASVEFDEDSNLISASYEVAQETDVFGHKIPARSRLYVDGRGQTKAAWVRSGCVVYGIELPWGSEIHFNEQKRLEAVKICSDCLVFGRRIIAKSSWEALEKRQRARLSKETEGPFAGWTEIPKESWIHYGEKGDVLGITEPDFPDSNDSEEDET